MRPTLTLTYRIVKGKSVALLTNILGKENSWYIFISNVIVA